MTCFSLNLKSWISDINAIGVAIDSLNNVNVPRTGISIANGQELSTNAVTQYTAAIKGLNAEQAKAALSTTALSEAQQRQILAEAGLCKEVEQVTMSEVKQMVSEKALTSEKEQEILTTLQGAVVEGQWNKEKLEAIANNGGEAGAIASAILAKEADSAANITATATQKSFTIALWDSVKAQLAVAATNPFLWVTGAIVLITGIVKAIDTFTSSLDECSEELQQANDNFDSSKSEVETLEEEFTQCKERLAELQKLADNGTISVVEKEELDTLKETNNELERQLSIQQEKARLEAQNNASIADETLNKTTWSHYVSGTVYDAQTGLMLPTSSARVTPIEELQAAIQEYKQLDDEIQNLDTTSSDYESQLANLTNQQTEARQRASEMGDILSDVENAYVNVNQVNGELSTEQKNNYLIVRQANNEYASFLKTLENTETAYDNLSDGEKKSKLIENIKNNFKNKFGDLSNSLSLEGLNIEQLELLDDNTDIWFQNVGKQLDTYDTSNAVEQQNLLNESIQNTLEYAKTVGQESTEITPFNFSLWFEDDNNKDAVNEVTSNIETLSSALDTLKSKDLSQSELDELLIDLLPQFPELQKYTDGTISSVSSLRQGIIELCSVQPDGLIDILQTLKETDGVTEEVREQIDLYIQSLQNMSNLADASANDISSWLDISGNEEVLNDTVSAISTLNDAYEKLGETDLTQGDLSALLEDLLKEFPQLATYTDGTLNTVHQLRQAVGELARQQPIQVIEQLRELQENADTEEARNQIEQLIVSLENLSGFNIDMDTTIDTIQNMQDAMEELASFIQAINDDGGLHLDFDEARQWLNTFPELLNQATMCADGTVQLNEGVVNGFIQGREAEIQADGTARITELENAKEVFEAKRTYAQAKLDAVLAALDSQSIADMQETQNEISNIDDALAKALQADVDEVTANQLAAEAMSGNHDSLNDLIAQASEEESSNMADSLASMATNSQVQFGVVQQNIDATIDKINNMAQSFVNAMKGEQTAKTPLTVYGAGSKSKSQSITTTAPLSDQGKLDNASSIMNSILSDPSFTIKQQTAKRQAELTASLNALKTSLQTQISGYDSAISSINTQIDMLNKNLTVGLDDYVSNLQQKAAEAASNSSSDRDSSNEPNIETFDWIENKIEELEDSLDKLQTKADDTYSSWTDRNQSLQQAIAKTKESIDLQQQAYTRYMQEANSVGLSSYYKDLVQHGAIDISYISDENLADKIQTYQEWYEKAKACLDTQEDLQQSLNDLNNQKFTNVQSQYQSFEDLLDHSLTMLQNQLDLLEMKGLFANESYYNSMAGYTSQKIADLTSERKQLQDILNSSDLEQGTEAWNEMYSALLEIDEELSSLNNDLVEFNNNIRDLNWEVFEYLEDSISRITDETDYLVELLSNKDLYTDTGALSEYGKATIALHASAYDTYKQQAKDYLEEAQDLQKQVINGAGKDVLEQYNAMTDAHQEAVLAAEQEKEAILDLIENGLDAQLDAIQEIIDKKKEQMDIEKSLFDYQKSIQEKTKTVASLEKQLVSTQDDDSEDAMARIQKIKVELEEAKADLKETEYEQYLSDTETMLDQLSEDYESWMNERMDNSDALLAEIVGEINLQGSDILATLNDVADEYGTMISDSIVTIFNADSPFSTALTTLSDGVSTGFNQVTTGIAGTTTAINNLIEKIVAITEADASKTNAGENVSVNASKPVSATTANSSIKNTTTTTSNKSSAITSSSKVTTGSGNGKPEVGDVVTYTGQYMYTSRGAQPLGSVYSGVPNAVVIDKIQPDSTYWHPTHPYHIRPADNPNGDFGWVALNQLKGYDKGTRHINRDQYAWIDEHDKNEIIVRKSDNALLTRLKPKDGVIPNNLTENLFAWGSLNPQDFTNKLLSNSSINLIPNIQDTGNSSVEVGDIHITVEGANITDYDTFKKKLIGDKQIEKSICTMVNNSIMGKSTIEKNRFVR